MVTFLFAALAVVQQVNVHASVNRDEIAVGDTVVLTVTVNAGGSDALKISDPVLKGLSVYGTQDRTTVQIVSGAASRVTSRVLFLRAAREGRASIGPITVRQGNATATTLPIAIDVLAATGGKEESMSPVVRYLIDNAKPPGGGDEVTVRVLVSKNTLILGDQVDLLVAAWFPRDVRLRLRSSPTLDPPVLQGAWSYRQVSPVDVAASRNIGGRWFDLFVHYQAVFPLVAGTLEIGSATVSYSVPVSFSFLSREIRREVKSAPESLEVSPQPAQRRPKDFGGTAGRDVKLIVNASPDDLRVGESATVIARVEGVGNVSLWPEPELRWPVGLRVYPGEVKTDVKTGGGPISGSRTFTYVVVPDSAGTLTVSSPAFPYFDTGDNTYKTARARTFAFSVRRSSRITSERQVAPPLMPGGSIAFPDRIAVVPMWVWILLLLVPPSLVLGWRLKPALTLHRHRPEPRKFATLVERVAVEFEATLVRLVPESGSLEGRQLTEALMAAGVEAPVAAHAGKVKERLRRVVYGPGGVSADSDELIAEVHEVLNALTKTRDSLTAVVTTILLFGFAASGLAAQTGSPQALYEAEAYQSAADSFAVQASRSPGVAANWYNLGSALYVMRQYGRARVAWSRAARLDPHSVTVRKALELLPELDPRSGSLLWVSPVTRSEAMVIGVVLWFLAWGAIGLRRNTRLAVAAGTLAVAFVSYGFYVQSRYRTPVAVIVINETDVREAPYGAAKALSKLADGMAARIESKKGGWMLVSRGNFRGWVRDKAVEIL